MRNIRLAIVFIVLIGTLPLIAAEPAPEVAPETEATKIIAFAENLTAEAIEGQSQPYNLLTNNCATFCEEALQRGGTSTQITLINTPRNVIEELQEEADASYSYEPN